MLILICSLVRGHNTVTALMKDTNLPYGEVVDKLQALILYGMLREQNGIFLFVEENWTHEHAYAILTNGRDIISKEVDGQARK